MIRENYSLWQTRSGALWRVSGGEFFLASTVPMGHILGAGVEPRDGETQAPQAACRPFAHA